MIEPNNDQQTKCEICKVCLFWRKSSELLAHWSGYSEQPFDQVIDRFIIFKNLPRSGESLLNLF